ncbi:MAG TPA: alpha/beta hydrolase [Alphaproteobacteria bacterium]|jgi:pimeloyl-ACP methyl ester carboxylesterase
MNSLAEKFVAAAGTRTRVVQGGPAREPILFLHGGVSGATLYCSGAHIWSPCLGRFAAGRRVAAPDLPGFGETPAPEGGAAVDRAGRYVLALIDALGLAPCHLVGHDEGGLIALWSALEAPAKIRSVGVVAGGAVAPSGDSVASLALLNPPRPLWSRAAQAWALERLSHAPHHITPDLLDLCAACAGAPPHCDAITGAGRSFLASIAPAKARLYAHCRERAFPVPVQLVWARNDPLASVEQGMALFKLIAERQRATQFHVINRAGSLPFREQPEAFHAVVSAFHDGIAAEH